MYLYLFVYLGTLHLYLCEVGQSHPPALWSSEGRGSHLTGCHLAPEWGSKQQPSQMCVVLFFFFINTILTFRQKNIFISNQLHNKSSRKPLDSSLSNKWPSGLTSEHRQIKHKPLFFFQRVRGRAGVAPRHVGVVLGCVWGQLVYRGDYGPMHPLCF